MEYDYLVLADAVELLEEAGYVVGQREGDAFKQVSPKELRDVVE